VLEPILVAAFSLNVKLGWDAMIRTLAPVDGADQKIEAAAELFDRR